MRMKIHSACAFCFFYFAVHAQVTFTVEAKNIKAAVSPTLWGLFFEDINRGADGGLYAEMVENRSFDFPKPMTGWETWPQRVHDGIFVVNQSALNLNDPKYMSVTIAVPDTVGLVNEGFHGMSFQKDSAYLLTLRYRQKNEGIHIRYIQLNGKNQIIGQQDVKAGAAAGWITKTIRIIANDSATAGRLVVIFEGAGKMDIDRISLFPKDNWNNLRKDLVQKLYNLHPGFLRFPGGCIVEGNNLDERYRWKNTIGPVDDRRLVQTVWNDRVASRPTPDYFESYGLGFFEYFQLCEYIGASPLPIINCGMSCQFDAAEVVPVNELGPYINDALDLIEFANGDAHTKWGAKRAAMGHPAPFKMKLLGVGNENWGPQYAERLALFTARIKAKYPYIRLVNATGYSRIDPVFRYMDSVLRKRHADIIDEHFYASPEWFLQNATRYDNYDRSGPKICIGEYAAQSDRVGSQQNVNNLKTALSEAAFMTGIERNAGVVTMASYAPLFADTKDWQWTPNLIWFDNSRSYNTPNYYVQQLFSLNKGTAVIPVTLDNKPITGQDSVWASSVINDSSHEVILKIVNMNGSVRKRTVEFTDAKLQKNAIVTMLFHDDPGVMNSLEQPDLIVPVTTEIVVSGKEIKLELKPYSLTVVRLKIK